MAKAAKDKDKAIKDKVAKPRQRKDCQVAKCKPYEPHLSHNGFPRPPDATLRSIGEQKHSHVCILC